MTDSSGKARLRWTLGGEAGAQRLVIRLRDDTASAVVTARAAAGEPTSLTLVGPGRWGGLTQLPVTLSLTDAYGNPVAGRVVTLRTGSGLGQAGAGHHRWRGSSAGALGRGGQGAECAGRRR